MAIPVTQRRSLACARAPVYAALAAFCLLLPAAARPSDGGGTSGAVDITLIAPPDAPPAGIKVISLADAGGVPEQAVAAEEPAGPAEPAGSAPPVLRLSDAVAAALEHSPGLDALQWQAIAQWEQAQSVAGYSGLATEFSILGMQTDSPLGVFAGKLSQGRVTQADFDPAVLNDPGFLGTVEYKLKLMYPLFTSGRIELLANALKLNSEALDFDRLGAQHQLTGRVIEAYFCHDLLARQLAVLADARQTIDELTRMIASLEREGLAMKADLAAADVEAANLADELNKARTNLALTETVLALLTGRENGPFTSEISVEPDVLEVPTLEAATQLALDNRPDLQAMDKRVCAATDVLDEAIRKRNPALGAFAEGKHASPGLPGQGHTEGTVGVQLTLDLDTAGVIRHEIDKKRADLEAARLGFEQLKEMARIEVAQAQSAVVSSRGSIESFQAQGDKAAENLRVVRNRYREGLTNYLDLRMAVTTLKESRLRELSARYGFLLAYMRLLAATGQIGGEQDPFLNMAAQETGNNLEPEASQNGAASTAAPGGYGNAG